MPKGKKWVKEKRGGSIMAVDFDAKLRVSGSTCPSKPVEPDYDSDELLLVRDDEFLEFKEDRAYLDKFTVPLAKKALDHFNCSVDSCFELVQVTDFGMEDVLDPDLLLFHMNFLAKSKVDRHSKLFYAEVKTLSLDDPIRESDIMVLGCCMLRQVDSGNPMGFHCKVCDSDTLIHPGPLHGYCIDKGDRFEKAIFWKNRPSKSSYSGTLKQHTTAAKKHFYIACAKKAVKYLNKKWELLELVGGIDRLDDPNSVIHVNFTVGSNERPVLCFAEVYLPFKFAGQNWTKEKEKYLKVGGSCTMEEVKSEAKDDANGRVCGMCEFELIHPGPAYGFCSLIGDDFAESDFMRKVLGGFLRDNDNKHYRVSTVESMDAGVGV